MSFKAETEFNMLKSKGNGSQKLKHHVIKTNSGVDVLKTAAVYGANAAGKSNLVKAIAYLKSIVLGEESILMPQSKRFRLDESYKSKPTTFRLEFEYQGTHFDYAIEIFKGKIKEEWLYLIDNVAKSKETLLFKRENNEVTFGEYFKDSEDLSYAKKFLSKELKETQTVLKICYEVFGDNKILNQAIEIFNKIRILDINDTYFSDINKMFLNLRLRTFSEKLLVNSKTGIQSINVERIDAESFFGYDDVESKMKLIDTYENIVIDKKGLKSISLDFYKQRSYNTFTKEGNQYFVEILKTKHFNSDNLFDFDEESDGTNRLFELSPAFEQLIDNEIVYIIDELERSMHPLLAKELLRMYALNSKSKSQLIFTTHESHLLDDELLRRDEIWFTEKKQDGSTEFYPLSNFNPRGDKVLERGYLQGRYGGIPFLGDFSKLIVEENLVENES
jgi:AAA15 family ATPase/GTPase